MSLLGLMLLFNIGWGEIVLIVIVILLLFGGKKIPELMQGLGKGVRSFKKGLNEVEEELTTPELEKYIEKSNRAADRLDAAKAAIPKQKKLVKERTFDEATGKAKTRLRFEEREKPMPGSKSHKNPGGY